MTRDFKYLTKRTRFRPFLAFLLFFVFSAGLFGQDSLSESKISPSIKLSYKISDGKRSVKVEVSRKEDRKFIPVENIIVNLYNGEVKKYDPATAEGWMGNTVTNDEGICVFNLTEKFNKLTEGKQQYTFIASIGSDPVYEDTEEQITMNLASIKLSHTSDDSLTTVAATLSRFQDSAEVPVPETELKLYVKRTFGMLPFGEEGLSTDENGEVSGTLPTDLPGNHDKTITVMAVYVDEENDGIVEVSQNVPWKIAPIENIWNNRTMWATGSNAPIPLVMVTVGLIVLIWGTIFYLFSFLFKIKKLR